MCCVKNIETELYFEREKRTTSLKFFFFLIFDFPFNIPIPARLLLVEAPQTLLFCYCVKL